MYSRNCTTNLKVFYISLHIKELKFRLNKRKKNIKGEKKNIFNDMSGKVTCNANSLIIVLI